MKKASTTATEAAVMPRKEEDTNEAV